MIKIPGGHVHMRDNRKNIQWTEKIAPFYLSKNVVTVELYGAITGERLPAEEAQLPKANISWEEAITACNLFSQKAGLKECYSLTNNSEDMIWDQLANGYRLPTEAEWQYACQAGKPGYRYGELDEIAWYKDNSDGKLHPVGEKKPNAWGLHDMIGNVWEWCWDLYDLEVYGSYRIFRGGSWAEEARGCGSTNRRRSHPTFGIDDLGFRLARNG